MIQDNLIIQYRDEELKKKKDKYYPENSVKSD